MELYGYEHYEEGKLLKLVESTVVCSLEEIDGLIHTLEIHKRDLLKWYKENPDVLVNDELETQYCDCVEDKSEQPAFVLITYI